jgi:hypothetical protein
VRLQDPAHAVGRHGGVVDVPAVAIFLHAEDAVVVADRADGDVNALLLAGEAFEDGGLSDHGAARIVDHAERRVNAHSKFGALTGRV